MGFGGMAYGGDLYGAGLGEGGASELSIINRLPAGPAAIPLNSAVNFCVVGPANITSIGVSVFYRSDRNRYVIYELDGFTVPYAPNSTIGGIGTATVALSLFEFSGWRDRVVSITVFGIDANGTLFSLEALE